MPGAASMVTREPAGDMAIALSSRFVRIWRTVIA
jgi:hypothetical protein